MLSYYIVSVNTISYHKTDEVTTNNQAMGDYELSIITYKY